MDFFFKLTGTPRKSFIKQTCAAKIELNDMILVCWPANCLPIVSNSLSMRVGEWKQTCLHMLDIIRQLLPLCLFMRSPHHFQLHGPQTGALISSRFPVKICQLFNHNAFFLHILIGSLTSAAARKKCAHTHTRTHMQSPLLPPTEKHTQTCTY